LAEDRIGGWSGYDTQTAAYVETLVGLGYTPDPYETDQLADRREPAVTVSE
jgi:hypothetical protein